MDSHQDASSYDIQVVKPITQKNWLTKIKTKLRLKKKPKDQIKQPQKRKKIIKVFLVILIVFLVFLVYFLFAFLKIKKPAQNLMASVKASAQAVQDKDLTAAENHLSESSRHLTDLQKKYRLITPFKYIPFLGAYIKDGQRVLTAADYGLETGELLIEAVKPYADVLGFSGTEAELQIQTAEEKIIFILETLDKISPKLDEVSQKAALIESEISYINPQRYPETIKGKPVKSQIITLQQSLKDAQNSLKNIKPLLSLLPQLLGQDKSRRYLLIFQNDAELRASGGFLTAYAILEVHKGIVKPLISSDIYDLDERFGNRLPAPEPIKKYLPLVYNWHLRDMNLSPDFKVSMETFFPNYQAVAQYKDVDGLIAIDTQVPVDILKIIGEVGVADWGSYSAEIVPECNCPQVVYKMEDYATRPTYYVKENRKGMIGPLMHSILLNVMNSPKKLWPQFVSVGLKNINEKHILFYFEDEDMQALAENFNAAGRIVDYDGDYFHLNDTNFAGAKSNMYVEQEVIQDIEVDSSGEITKTVTITYTNPEPPDDCNLETGGLCLNGLLRDWVRVYVPEGSELIEVLGSDIDAAVLKDLNKTVIEAFIELRPESKTKLIIKYKLPFKLENNQYKMLIQKQPGTKNHHYAINFKNQAQEFNLEQDKEIIF